MTPHPTNQPNHNKASQQSKPTREAASQQGHSQQGHSRQGHSARREGIQASRRKMLFTLGFGIANVAILRRMRIPQTGSAARSGQQTSTASRQSIVTVKESQTPPIPILDGAEQANPHMDNPNHVFDVLITNGRVIDPQSGFDALADIGINGGTVTAIALAARGSTSQAAPAGQLQANRKLQANRTIDATGLVVSPGFIDMLSYSPNGYGEWFKLADGVTSNIGMHGLDDRATRWFNRHTNGSSPIHFGGAYDHDIVRASHDVSPYENTNTSLANAIVKDAETDLRNGFIGLHMQPEYTPGTTSEELLAHAKLAKKHDVPLCVHARYSDNILPGTNLEAIHELINAARETGAHVHVEHINSTGGTGVMSEALGLLNDAIGEGLTLTACVYPYKFWATYLKSARFQDWQTKYNISYNDLQVAGSSQRLTENTFAEAYAANKLTAAFAMSSEDVELPLQTDFVMIGSDAILQPAHNNHPRSTGCFSKVLGHYVRERNVISLKTALEKMTIRPAELLQHRCPDLRRKGRLSIGADADITIFNPDTIIDRSSIANPAQQSEGVEWVLVEGVIARTPETVDVVPNSEELITRELAGRALKSNINTA